MTWLSFGVFGVAVFIVGLWGLGRWRWSAKAQVLLERLEATRARAAVKRFDPGELDGLPEPVARHLRAAIPPGTPIIRAVDVTHQGSFNTSETGERWRPFTSRQHVVTRRPGFVWDARVSMAPGLAVHVHDAYVGGEGILEPALLGLFSLARLRDRGEMARGELMRFVAEAAWYPTALLPSQGLQWERIDANSARATLVDGAIRVCLSFHFGADGLLDRVRAESRGRMVGDQCIPTPWEGRMSNYQRRDGLLIPLDGEVAWLTPAGRLPYWRGTITELSYER
ncbi:DUF6544 family protein [Thauera sp.]|uniref:DUF6920 family protein n=1 Tax=Thauera sp. TaxID=1905334 RepID=UPI002C76705A|nr:DUF6544 family protein [Thauera sp.]HRP25445.1 hypothetical protein [Thauera sp.]